MNGNGKDHDETRDLKQLLASRCARKDRQKNEKQRAQSTRSKPGDQETTPESPTESRTAIGKKRWDG